MKHLRQLPNEDADLVDKLHIEAIVDSKSALNYSYRYIQRVYPMVRIINGKC